MNRSSLLCAAAAATALLAAPAAAFADGASVVAGPLKAKGYDITLTATDGGASDSFAVMAVKRAGQSTQMHTWSFAKGVSVTIKGAKATIKGSLGRYGAINATVNAGAKATGKVPAGCTGTAGSARSGRLTGATKLALDTTYFRTLAPKGLKAQILQGGSLKCSGTGSTGAQYKGLMLAATSDGADGQLMVSVLKDGAKVTQQVMRNDAPAATAPASVFHLISAQTGATGLDAAADLSSATAAAAGPFLSGTLAFAGQPLGTMATGTISGDFAARFDSIGAQGPAAGTSGMLMQQ
jgi:hypothetical protein